jgi:tRNA modification GTPase
MTLWPEGDTIAAIATPLGVGGIGIVRLSGPDSLPLARRLFRPRHPGSAWQSHRFSLGQVLDAQGAVIDEVLLVYMQAPQTYTREDVVEIHCHSGVAVLRRVLEETLALGARLARPGEFTLRAFLAGRLDLTQAEAVQELISARTEAGVKVAAAHLAGGLREKLTEARQNLLYLLAIIEAMLDFPEEAADAYPMDATVELGAQRYSLELLAQTYREGRLLREGVLVVIAGRPNVGKSSLLNRLLAAEKAIVTPIPGTTRDLIEETLNLGGVPVRLTDTAGLRNPQDLVEEIGVSRARERLAQADLVLYILDGSLPLEADDLAALSDLADRPALVVVNKADLPQAVSEETLRGATALPRVQVSALTGQGLEGLREAVLGQILQEGLSGGGEIITQERHYQHLKQCLACLTRAEDLLPKARGKDAPWELAAQELYEAVQELGAITGEEVGEEILDRIFSQFCIGK